MLGENVVSCAALYRFRLFFSSCGGCQEMKLGYKKMRDELQIFVNKSISGKNFHGITNWL